MYPIHVISLDHLFAYLQEVIPDQGVGRVKVEPLTGLCGALCFTVLGEGAPLLIHDQPLGMAVHYMLRGEGHGRRVGPYIKDIQPGMNL